MTTISHTLIALAWGVATSIAITACASGNDVNSVDYTATDAAVGGSGGGGSSTTPPPPTAAPTSTAVGSCNSSFCPATGMGSACCVTANGPCGTDFGNGCVSSLPEDGGS